MRTIAENIYSKDATFVAKLQAAQHSAVERDEEEANSYKTYTFEDRSMLTFEMGNRNLTTGQR